MTTHASDRRRLLPWAIAVVVLLLVAVAMQVTDAVNWAPGDFLAAALIMALGLGVWEIAQRLTPHRGRRALAAAAIWLVVIWIWAELAVGVVTTLGS
ncbi:hypothetical protein FHG66_09075 [Rubellimicrobium rubrum]|uniref:Uncharacterized protein n=1 Tax=Rubellimicrobium rubrum TaxID=2585369 RepID=A0A5C4N1B9_9RHOB|nr:hypothetical protein [Rubellimicrobium rubrum]TNC50104.1 hypothetical protein FHG66_09075 [Rubellimicrobium rubrum]